VLGIVALFLLVLLVHPQPPLLRPGSPAPAVSLRTAAGAQVHAVGAGARGPVLLEFLETACVTCQGRAAGLCAVAAAHPSALVAGVDAGNESAQQLQAYQARYVPADCAMVFLLDPGLSVSRSYEVAVVPTVYVVDRNGNIAYGGIGAQGLDDASAALRQAGA